MSDAAQGERLARATHAENLERNPLLAELLRDMRQDAINTWIGSGSVAQREEQWFRVRVADDFAAKIQRAIDDAKMVQGREQRARRAAAAERT